MRTRLGAPGQSLALGLSFALSYFFLLIPGGCANSGIDPRSLSQAQLNAIETREIDGTLEETFNAASNALFDAGYTISMSDRQAGLLTGESAEAYDGPRFAWAPAPVPHTFHTLSVQVRPLGPRLTSVRVKTAENGVAVIREEAIDEFWVLMQRQVLMKAPSSAMDAPTPGAPASTDAGPSSGGTPVKRR